MSNRRQGNEEMISKNEMHNNIYYHYYVLPTNNSNNDSIKMHKYNKKEVIRTLNIYQS